MNKGLPARKKQVPQININSETRMGCDDVMNKKRSRDCAKIAVATGLVENSHQKFDKANIERLYGPDAIMDDRPLKRRANDNGNLDTHHGHHKDKKVCMLSTLKGLEKSSSIRTI
ncbi:hypothetical protein GLOIN_2v1527507 [Rhizophagus irregularis DAOM 181602=DAOM 197198]|uniref:Uncharacterized protein n=1 Tax=Rhizophagus irregularis (strain DAOM 197198w) TaxID=1432141 RepID=A0A015NII7_RHIIW|nr:hypothetical protein RirG_007580 [Rhizophagus irregularis DAOM 197198w]GBC49913.1 hypothetical protein GLOIN_2v1527507 [Rhizophagus irregularis DAOM 181602=DAOM 197198]